MIDLLSQYGLNNIGSTASVLSLGITIVGFLVTLNRVAQNRKVSERTQKIVDKEMRRVAERMAQTKIQDAKRLAKELTEHFKRRDWGRARDCGDRLCESLHFLREGWTKEGGPQSIITFYISDVSEIIKRADQSKPLSPKMIDRIYEITDFLRSADAQISRIRVNT